jgi:hypothetical protein
MVYMSVTKNYNNMVRSHSPAHVITMIISENGEKSTIG